MNYKNKKTNLHTEIKDLISIIKKINLSKKNINTIIEKIYQTIKKGNKVFICGNGGSAGEAQHLAAEFLVRLNPKVIRKPFPVITLAQDVSTLTAIGNDFNFKYIFSRNLQALAKKNDLLFVLSTSGNSKNIIEVLKKAKKMGITSLSFLGCGGGKARSLSDLSLIVPSRNVARIQECHLFLGHFILNEVEKNLINSDEV